MNISVLAIGTLLRSPKHEYRVESFLGYGGFGITYKVSAEVDTTIQVENIKQKKTERIDFAIKEFFLKDCCERDSQNVVHYPSFAKETVENAHCDFLAEAHQLNMLCHKSPHIVHVNEAFEANGTAYYVMEYLNGGSLEEYVHQHGSLSWTEAKEVIVPIATAVGLLHAEHLLHMDIKPDNIIFKTDEQGEEMPVLIDFGIAKHFSKNGKPVSRPIAKGASDGYAPVEQFVSVDKFSPEIDVYGLGATLFFMLTGQQPPKATDIQSPNTVTMLLPSSLAKEYKEVVAQAMNPNRFNRTKTVAVFLDSLCRETVVIGSQPTKPIVRPKKLMNAAVIAICAAVFAAIVAVVMTLQISGSLEESQGKQDKTMVDSTTSPSTNNMDEQPTARVTDQTTTDEVEDVMLTPVQQMQNGDKQKNVKDHKDVTENVQKNEKDVKTSTSSVHTGTLDLGYATYSGEIKDGKAHGKGVLTFHTSHVIEPNDPQYEASAGDKVSGDFVNGHLTFGRWTSEEKKGMRILMIGE